jgi:FAD/FMN-containing dehydrogenase
MARTYGLASDRVTAFEVVTGDGQLRRATPDQEPELFFGLRGGKGALGVVTAVEFDLVVQPRFYGGALWFAAEHAAEALAAWREWSAGLPGAGTTSFAVRNLPARPGVPEPLAGRTTLAVRFLWTGDEASGAAAVAPVRAAAPVLLDGVRELPYAAVDAVHTDPVDPLPASEASAPLTAFPKEAAAALLDLALDGSPQAVVEVRQLGGATARASVRASAYSSRDAAYSFFCVGAAGTPGLQDHTAQLLKALDAWTGGPALPNYAGSPTPLAGCFDAPTLTRLRTALRHYDPDEVMAVGRALSS